ncbi:hypothetical protein ACQP3J_30735, partial [Escherichia coli]
KVNNYVKKQKPTNSAFPPSHTQSGQGQGITNLSPPIVSKKSLQGWLKLHSEELRIIVALWLLCNTKSFAFKYLCLNPQIEGS